MPMSTHSHACEHFLCCPSLTKLQGKWGEGGGDNASSWQGFPADERTTADDPIPFPLDERLSQTWRIEDQHPGAATKSHTEKMPAVTREPLFHSITPNTVDA